MRSALTHLRLAFGLLSIVPVGEISPTEDDLHASTGWFAFVGLIIGAATVGAIAAVGSVAWRVADVWVIEVAPGLFAALVIAAWALTTRLLHWDGLADVADAIGGARDHRGRLEILHDSRVGAFAVATVAIVLLVQYSALSLILSHAERVGWLLLAVPVFGRLSAVCAAWLGTSARGDGLGASVIGTPRLSSVIWTGVCIIIAGMPAVLATGWTGGTAIAVGLLTAPVVPHIVSGRFGGVTGDVMGASVVLTETICLAVAGVLGVM